MSHEIKGGETEGKVSGKKPFTCWRREVEGLWSKKETGILIVHLFGRITESGKVRSRRVYAAGATGKRFRITHQMKEVTG